MLEIEKIRKKHKELCDEIRKFNYYYYNLSKPLVSNADYDVKYQNLLAFEKLYASMLDLECSPTQTVGGGSTLKTLPHESPMLSLANCWNKQEVLSFYTRVFKEALKCCLPIRFTCEAKIDGIAISLLYNHGILQYALTRGDGKNGEVVTNTIKHIPNIPQNIEYSHKLLVRGEVTISENNFLKYKANNLDKKFATGRNFTSGVIRSLDPDIEKISHLSIYVYGIENSHNEDHVENLQLLAKLGFQVVDYKIAFTVDEIEKIYNEFYNFSSSYDKDGIVIKITNLLLRQKLSFTSTSPKWAIAYKFPNLICTTKLENIKFQVGRTGVFTPVAVLQPIYIEGVQITKATLHNVAFIIEKKVTIGCTVVLKRAGGVIPKIVDILEHTQNLVAIPSRCSFCKTTLILTDKQLFCPNVLKCPKILEQKIVFFVSKEAVNIKGCSTKIIQKLIQNNIISCELDIFNITFDQLINLPSFKYKSSMNLIESIEYSKKHITTASFIYALGIPGLGKVASEQLSKSIHAIDNLFTITVDKLQAIDHIGPKCARNIYSYLSCDSTREFIRKFKQCINLDMK